jgi:hypothetical protein
LQAGALDGADVDEDVLPAAIRLDEAEALLGVEPLDGACSRCSCPSEWARERAFATLPDLSDAGNVPSRWTARPGRWRRRRSRSSWPDAR